MDYYGDKFGAFFCAFPTRFLRMADFILSIVANAFDSVFFSIAEDLLPSSWSMPKKKKKREVLWSNVR